MNRKWIGSFALSAAVVLAVLAVPMYVVAQEAGKTPPSEEGDRQRDHHHRADRHHRGFLGVELRSLTDELRVHFGVPEDTGVLIASVTEEGPADRAGVRAGDILTGIDGEAVESFGDVRREVLHRGGDSVEIELYRDGRARRLEVTIGERRASRDRDWDEWGERWEHYGEEMGEYWGRFGEQMGERWGQFGEDVGERWGERGEEWGEHWGEWGTELGLNIAESMEEMDWEAFGKTMEESFGALEEMDWEGMGKELERTLQRMDRDLEKSLEQMERALERMDEELESHN